MKRFFEYIGLSLIILFSFYYTERVALLVRNNNPLMQNIRNVAPNTGVEPVNARIIDDTIIPGINGEVVNINKSYRRMRSFGVFNEYYLVFDVLSPEISLKANKEKIIVSGNRAKRAVSLVIDNNQDIKNFLIANNIDATMISYLNSYELLELEQINGEHDRNKFKNMESILNRNGKNVNICLIKNSNKDICLRNRKYLVKESLTLNGSNLALIRSNVESGSIILVTSSARVEDINILIRQIRYQGLRIIPLSQLISEEKN